MSLNLRITCYPNNEIRIRLAPPVSNRRGLLFESQDETKREGEEKRSKRPPHLTLVPNSKPPSTSDFQTPQPEKKPGYGGVPKSTRFGTNARRTLLRAGGAIDKLGLPTETGIFLTGTLPGSTHDAMQTICNYSSYIVHRLKAWVGKHVQSKYDFYVWERQKRGALHLHYFVVVPDADKRTYLLNNFKAQWCRLLDAVSLASGVDLYKKTANYSHKGRDRAIQAYAQTVQRSVAAYLSKYCSKREGKVGFGLRSQYCPVRWWGVSRPLLQELAARTFSYEVEFHHHYTGRLKYEELTSELESMSIKGYSYGDKVGYGLNKVYYLCPDELYLCFNQITQPVRIPTMQPTLTIESQVLSLYTMTCYLQKQNKLWLLFWNNLTPQSQKSVTRLTESRCISSFDAYALATDLEYWSSYIQATSNYWGDILNRVNVRSAQVARFMENRVLIEEEWRVPDPASEAIR